MCQIFFSKEANPPKQALIDANSMNDDGFGYAWRDGGTVRYVKGFEKQQLTDEVIKTYLDLPFPKAIHFRLATHGGTTPQLTHPFPIKRGNPHDLSGTSKSVLFHNGVWHSYDDRLRDAILAGTLNPNVLRGGMSDSRAMAVLAQRFGEDFLELLSLGSQKVLVLSGSSWSLFGNWTEKEGWSASNSRIFRTEKVVTGKGYVHHGAGLDRSGLVTGGQGSGTQGSLLSGGAADEREWGRRGTPPERGVDQKEGGGHLGVSSSTVVKPEGVYLSATYEEIKALEGEWAMNMRH